MFSLQDTINIKTYGEDYRYSHICSNTGRMLDFRKSILVEVEKFTEFLARKYFKEETKDKESAKANLLKIWSLIISSYLIEGKDIDSDIQQIEQIVKDPDSFEAESNDSLIEHFTQTALKTRECLIYNFGYSLFFAICKRMDLSFDDMYSYYLSRRIQK